MGLLFLTIYVPEEEIVGICYLSDPEDRAPGEAPEWELGGAFVDPGHQGMGIFHWMAVAALTSLKIMMDPDAAEETPVTGHVLASNQAPRGTLEKMGFTIDQEDVSFDPDAYPGLDHMSVQDDGRIHADVLRLPPSRFCDILDGALAFPGELGRGRNAKSAVINLPAFKDERLLREARDEICDGV